MDAQTAGTIVTGGVIVGLVAWMMGLRLYARMRRWPERSEWAATFAGLDVDTARRLLVEHLARRPVALERTDHGLTVRAQGVTTHLHLASHRQGSVHLEADLDLGLQGRWLRLAMAAMVLVFEPLVIVVVGWVLAHYVVDAADPAVRWQALQVLQIVHVIWPPFLIHFIATRLRRQARQEVERLGVLLDSESRDG